MSQIKEFILKDNETVQEVIYHHAIIIVPHLILCFLTLIFDFFLMYYLFLQGWWGVILFFSIILVLAVYAGRMIFLYKHNKFIITDQRVIDFEQTSFFDKNINETSLNKIDSVEASVKGLLPTLFGYGSLILRVKEELTPWELYKIKKPRRLQAVLCELKESRKNSTKVAVLPENDPLLLILAQTNLLTMAQKEELIERIGQQIDEVGGSV